MTATFVVSTKATRTMRYIDCVLTGNCFIANWDLTLSIPDLQRTINRISNNYNKILLSPIWKVEISTYDPDKVDDEPDFPPFTPLISPNHFPIYKEYYLQQHGKCQIKWYTREVTTINENMFTCLLPVKQSLVTVSGHTVNYPLFKDYLYTELEELDEPLT